MKTSESVAKIYPALIQFHAQAPKIAKESENPYFHSKYADIYTILDAIRQPLADLGLAVIQSVEALPDSDRIACTTRVIHASGEWIEGSAVVAVLKHDPQAYGSATTYARRYGLQGVLCLAAEDDDAESAMGDRSSPHAADPPRPVARAGTAYPATEKQKAMIVGLAGEIRGVAAADYVAKVLAAKGMKSLDDLRSKQASDWITSLLEEKNKAANAPDELDFVEEV